MTKHLPEWIMIRYAKLWSKFKNKEFTKGQAEKVINKDTAVAVFLSELRKAGWLELNIDEKDARKTIYKLKAPERAIKELVREMGR